MIETRNSSQTYHEGGEEIMDREVDEEEREFDDFLRGGKTVKLSLTPMSLKASEVSTTTIIISEGRGRGRERVEKRVDHETNRRQK